MVGQVIVNGTGSMADIANAITRSEQLEFTQLTGLVFDPNTAAQNLATFVATNTQFGAVAIVPTGTASPGTAIATNTTIYVNSTKTAVDIYHLPL